jgi:hypothetical protein
MQIAGIAVRRQIEKKCTASGLNFSCYYGIGVWLDDRFYNGREDAFDGLRG